jgi:5'-deoxynucleotidase YfbR-like HD superfamily hydrolase
MLVERISGMLDRGLPAHYRMMALLHDAPEYVIGDIISPFKAAVGATYKAVENRILAAIHMRFALPAEAPAALAKLVKKADRTAAFIEATRLAGFSVAEAEKFFGRPEIGLRDIEPLLVPLDSDQAEDRFLSVFRDLEGEMAQA